MRFLMNCIIFTLVCFLYAILPYDSYSFHILKPRRTQLRVYYCFLHIKTFLTTSDEGSAPSALARQASMLLIHQSDNGYLVDCHCVTHHKFVGGMALYPPTINDLSLEHRQTNHVYRQWDDGLFAVNIKPPRAFHATKRGYSCLDSNQGRRISSDAGFNALSARRVVNLVCIDQST